MFDEATQASSRILCSSVRAVPWADEAEQQLSRLEPSGCELAGDVCIFGAGLQNAPADTPGTHLKIEVAIQQGAPVSVPLCEQCHGQMRLSNSFPG